MSVVLTTVLLERILAGRTAAAGFVAPARWILLFVFNWSSPNLYRTFLEGNPLFIFWSLSVEEQFYLVYPAVVIAVTAGGWWSRQTRANLAVGAIAVGSFTWSVVASRPFAAANASTAVRAWELALGCLLAINGRLLLRLSQRIGGVLAWIGIAAILGSAMTLSVGSTPYPGAVALVPVAGGALVIAGGTPVPPWGPEWILRLSPVRLIGRWSYGMYLWQIPVILVVGHWITTYAGVPLAARFGLVVATTVVAGLSYRFLESPIRHAPSLVRSPGRTLVLAAMTTAAALVIVSLFAA